MRDAPWGFLSRWREPSRNFSPRGNENPLCLARLFEQNTGLDPATCQRGKPKSPEKRSRVPATATATFEPLPVIQPEFFNPHKSHGKCGAFVPLEAKPDKKHEVEAFLKSAFPLTQAQADTASWWAGLVSWAGRLRYPCNASLSISSLKFSAFPLPIKNRTSCI